MNAASVFKACVEAVRRGDLIEREGQDKEFHFQNWFEQRLRALALNFDQPGRNSYPDFRLVNFAEGFELKALAYPGRDATYDSNSQVPCGEHNGRQVYYVFGRYPKKPDGNRYPVLDLVLCHGSFLNADNAYVHKNKGFRGFGSYGDIFIRDRKMYVAPTPFALAEGTAHRFTLIVPAADQPGDDFVQVGELKRREVDNVVTAYQFDLTKNTLETKTSPNPTGGREHIFRAYRLKGDPVEAVKMKAPAAVIADMAEAAASTDEE